MVGTTRIDLDRLERNFTETSPPLCPVCGVPMVWGKFFPAWDEENVTYSKRYVTCHNWRCSYENKDIIEFQRTERNVLAAVDELRSLRRIIKDVWYTLIEGTLNDGPTTPLEAIDAALDCLRPYMENHEDQNRR